jgi:hypothetical protein
MSIPFLPKHLGPAADSQHHDTGLGTCEVVLVGGRGRQDRKVIVRTIPAEYMIVKCLLCVTVSVMVPAAVRTNEYFLTQPTLYPAGHSTVYPPVLSNTVALTIALFPENTQALSP